MSTLFFDGFEQFKDAANPPLLGALSRAGYTLDGGSPVQVAGRVAGSTALQMNAGVIKRTIPWTAPTFSVGLAFQMNAAARSAALTLEVPPGNNIMFWLSDISGAPYLNEHAGGSQPYLKTWYYVEVVLDRATGLASLWLNNRLELQDVDVHASFSAATEVTVSWGSKSSGPPPGVEEQVKSGSIYVEDIYAHDGDRLGPVIITTRFPTATVIGDWVLSPDATSHHGVAALRPPKPLDINLGADTLGQTDAFTSTALLPNGNAIIATGMCVLTRKSPTLEANLDLFIGDDISAEHRNAALVVDSEWRTLYQAFHTIAGDTTAGIEAAPFGLVISAA